MDSRLHKCICLYFLEHWWRLQKDLKYYFDNASDEHWRLKHKTWRKHSNTHILSIILKGKVNISSGVNFIFISQPLLGDIHPQGPLEAKPSYNAYTRACVSALRVTVCVCSGSCMHIMAESRWRRAVRRDKRWGWVSGPPWSSSPLHSFFQVFSCYVPNLKSSLNFTGTAKPGMSEGHVEANSLEGFCQPRKCLRCAL